MAKKFVIGMDMDGVLYPFDQAFNKLYTGYGGEEQDFTEWKDFSTLDEELVNKVWEDELLFNLAPPYPGAGVLMRMLVNIPDVKVVLLTNCGRNPQISIPSKWKWIRHWFPWVGVRDLIVAYHKQLVHVDVLVEDFPSNITKWLKDNPQGKAILVKRPWNEDKRAKLERKGVFVADDGLLSIVPIIQNIVKGESDGEES